MGLPGKGKRIRVVREPSKIEPLPEPVREPAPIETPKEPVKA